MGMFGVTPKKTGSTGPGVSDVIERFANLASFPTTGIEDLLYHAVDTDIMYFWNGAEYVSFCLLYTSPSPRDGLLSRMPSSA